MAVNLSPIGNGQQFFDNTGLPLNGGLIYTYQAGSSTALATYTDVGGLIANSNPIVLDSSGRLTDEIWLTYGFFYKFVVKTSAAVTLGTYDNIYGIVGVQTAVGTTIPAGMISLWYGSIGSVPTGWYLCDGTNGTPDLRDRFIVGAGSSYAVGATGGATTATLTINNLPAHTHGTSALTVSTTTTLSGNIGIKAPASSGGTTGVFTSTSDGNLFDAGGFYGTVKTSMNANHNHTISGSTDSVGSATSFSLLNPYYALAYVMKS
jgi:microcystin-dependent protein